MDHNVHVRVIGGVDVAKGEISSIGAYPEGVGIMAPKARTIVVRAEGVDNRAALICKQEMLSAGGDVAIPGSTIEMREERSTILVMGTLTQLDRLCKKLALQPFGLRDIASQIEAVLSNDALFERSLVIGSNALDISRRTAVMGVVNVTPDSFSDGGQYIDAESAIERGLALADEGADIIDVGGESTRPRSEPVPTREELARVIPVIEGLRERTDVPVSIDTRKPEVASSALDAGASMVNDVSGLGHEGMVELVASSDVPVVVMHMLGTPATMQSDPRYDDVVSDVYRFLRGRTEMALSKGVKPERIIVDPGIGFGKTREHNVALLRNLRSFKGLGYPVLVGTSRKTFLGDIMKLPVEERLEGTIASVTASIMNGADIVRVHDVREVRRAVLVADALGPKYCLP